MYFFVYDIDNDYYIKGFILYFYLRYAKDLVTLYDISMFSIVSL